MCVGTSGLNQFSVSKNTTQKHAGVSKMKMIFLSEVCLRRESKYAPLGAGFRYIFELEWMSSCGCSHLAVLCGCVSVFTGSGDACARAFNSRSGVLQKIFRGHKFIINCIQVRKGFLGGVFSFWLFPHLFCGNWCGWLFCVSWVGCCYSIRLEYSICNFRKAC